MLERQLRGRLSPDGMTKVAGLISDIDSEFRQQIGANDTIRRRLHIILITEPFNSADFVRTLGVLQTARSHFDSEMNARIATVVERLSPEDRRIFADAVLTLPPGPMG